MFWSNFPHLEKEWYSNYLTPRRFVMTTKKIECTSSCQYSQMYYIWQTFSIYWIDNKFKRIELLLFITKLYPYQPLLTPPPMLPLPTMKPLVQAN